MSPYLVDHLSFSTRRTRNGYTTTVVHLDVLVLPPSPQLDQKIVDLVLHLQHTLLSPHHDSIHPPHVRPRTLRGLNRRL